MSRFPDDETVTKLYRKPRRKPRRQPVTATSRQLSATETAYIKLAVAGKTKREIAAIHGVHVSTVNDLLAKAYSKMGVYTRIEALRYALRHGIVTLDEACATAGITGEGR